MGLENKVAIVTGAAGGIGRATAMRLAAAGADVGLVDIDAKVADVADAARAAGGKAEAAVFDIADPDEAANGVDRLRHALGPVAILANVAGIVDNLAPLAKMSPQSWSREIAVNLGGAFNMIQATIGDMIEAGWGRIVILSSEAARSGLGGQVAYSASKSGLLGLARNVAIEHGRDGITCNTILPGLIATEKVNAMPARIRDGIVAETPAGRTGTVDEVAAVIAFLASDEAGFLNGAEIDIDGGYRLNTSTFGGRKSGDARNRAKS